jgi:hypothetical protein
MVSGEIVWNPPPFRLQSHATALIFRAADLDVRRRLSRWGVGGSMSSDRFVAPIMNRGTGGLTYDPPISVSTASVVRSSTERQPHCVRCSPAPPS